MTLKSFWLVDDKFLRSPSSNPTIQIDFWGSRAVQLRSKISTRLWFVRMRNLVCFFHLSWFQLKNWLLFPRIILSIEALISCLRVSSILAKICSNETWKLPWLFFQWVDLRLRAFVAIDSKPVRPFSVIFD